MKTTHAPQRGVFSFPKVNVWSLFVAVVVVLVVTPIGVIYSSLLQNTGDIWTHLIGNVLPRVTWNTLSLALGVALGTTVVGVSLAWIISAYEFPGRKFFDWFLILPLAMPTYVLAFVWIGMFDFSSPVSTWFRSVGVALPPIRSLGGLIFVMTLALYPYVYLLARNAFMSMGESMIEAASSLGMNRRQIFFKVALPMARPWIVGGMMLVIMETMADFGTVSIFNYDTFTTAIYKTWFGFFSIEGASQLSSILVTFVLAIILVEMFLRKNRGYALQASGWSQKKRQLIQGRKAFFMGLFPGLVLLCGFFIPVGQLVFWSFEKASTELDLRYFTLLWHTLLLGVLAAAVISFTALLLAYSTKRQPHAIIKVLTRIATMGYGIPGTVLAVGVFSSLVWFDDGLTQIVNQLFGIGIVKVFTGTIAAMTLAYLVRYLAVGFQPIDSAMQRITESIDHAARNFGYRGLDRLFRVYFPMIKKGAFTAFILVCVDVMKEMPITLMTRPFGWDTFAVRIFEMTSEGEWERAALPAVFLVLSGMIPVIFLTQQKESM